MVVPYFSNLGFKYYVCFVDDFSRYTWIYPLKRKYEVHARFQDFQALVENLFDCKIKIFQSDGGREFDNQPLLDHFRTCGIAFRKFCPETEQQNGVVEHKHRHIIEFAHTMLIESSLRG